MMVVLLSLLTQLGQWIWRTSLQATLAFFLVAVAQAILRRQLPPRWVTALGLLVMIRLALPWLPASPLSLYQFWPRGPERQESLLHFEDRWNTVSVVAEIERLIAGPRLPASRRSSFAPGQAPPPAQDGISSAPPLWLEWLRLHPFTALWLAGMLALGPTLLIKSFRLTRRISRVRPITESRWLNLLEDCKTDMGLHIPLTLVETDHVHGPMLMGFIRPRLLLPEGLLELLTADQARCIFLHELAHIRRKDILLGWFIAFLLLLHWFNPLVWLASLRFRADRELACDAEALAHLATEQRPEYGRTLLQLAETLSAAPLIPTLAGIVEHENDLKRRMIMIMRFRRPKVLASLCGGVALLLLGVCVLTVPIQALGTQDKVDYPFVNDPELSGAWRSVDFVEDPATFSPSQHQSQADLYVRRVCVSPEGYWSINTPAPVQNPTLKWTKGMLLSIQNRTASHYTIKTLDGRKYLFMEWKSGDYTIRNQKPWFYVLVKADGEPVPNLTPARKMRTNNNQSPTGGGKITYGAIPSKPLPLGIHGHPGPANFSRPLDQFPTYNPASPQNWQVDLRSRDLTKFDLHGRGADLMFADFDSQTKWPASLPEVFNPKRVMDVGRNPGLGLRQLHAKGITGKGVGIAIIDQNLLLDHVEYKDRLRHYEEIHWPVDAKSSSMHGPAVASIAVGKTVGVAPEADLYYIAEMHGEMAPNRSFDWDFSWLAISIKRILELNRSLPPAQKIRVISISVGWRPEQKGYDLMQTAIAQAKKDGVFIVSSSLEETAGFSFHGLGRDSLADPDQVQSCLPGLFWQNSFYADPSGFFSAEALLVPMDSRCTASPTGTEDYVFYRNGGLSWSIPYVAGLYALACQVRPDVTPELFWKAALETGATITLQHAGKPYQLGKIAQPEKLLNKLRRAQ